MNVIHKMNLFLFGLVLSLSANAAEQRIDFTQLTVPTTYNYYLACPKDFCKKANTERIIQIYDLSATDLEAVWKSVIDNESRIEKVVEDPSKGYYQYIQRTAILQLPNVITIQIIAVSDKSSTFAIYSKSVYGYYDFNANSSRINRWLDALDTAVAAKSQQP